MSTDENNIQVTYSIAELSDAPMVSDFTPNIWLAVAMTEVQSCVKFKCG